MTKATGTATSHINLFDEIHDFCVDCGWTSLLHTSGGPTVLRAPGDSVGNEYFLYLDIVTDVANAVYSIRMRAGIGYESGLPFETQNGISPAVFFNVWQNAMPYWFYGNGRNIKVAVKVNVSYITMYAGLFLPFALPTVEYLKPFYIGANNGISAPHDLSNSRNRMIADPGIGSAYYMDFDGATWRRVTNHIASTANTGLDIPSSAVMWPHRALLFYPFSIRTDDWATNGFLKLRPNKNGETPMFPCHIVGLNGPKCLVGTLEGVYSTGGFNRVSEQTQTFDGRTFRMFQNIFRSTPRDFMAIEEVA